MTLQPTLREDFRDLIAECWSVEAATKRLQDEYGVGQSDDVDNDFWLGLAATQHRLGHVADGVIERALGIAKSAAELDRWPSADRNRRAAAWGTN
jgi:hypothetical protein